MSRTSCFALLLSGALLASSAVAVAAQPGDGTRLFARMGDGSPREGGSGGRAKYRSGERGASLSIGVFNLPVEPGTTLTVRACGGVVGTITVEQGKRDPSVVAGRLNLSTRNDNMAPSCYPGANVRVNGARIMLEGKLRKGRGN